MKIKKILFYGLGNGRDHANHISSDLSTNIEVYSIIQNENALMEKCNNVIRTSNFEETLKITKKINPDLVVISNRADLNNGISEKFEKEGYKVFGISSDVAKLETNKEYSKAFMMRNKIRTPNYFIANNQEEALALVSKNWNKSKYGYVFKVDQFSRNSFERTAVPESIEEAINEIYRLFGTTPNAKLVIEERITGYELSLHVFINKDKYTILPMVQDYKKKYPGNEGPMTAGTASVASSKEYPKELLTRLKKEIIEPTIQGFKNEELTYNYILYIGIMVSTDGTPYVLEYNTRTGNPEWLALLGLLNIPYSELLEKYYNNIDEMSKCWKKDFTSVAMYGFSSGYPETDRSSFEETITGLDMVKKDTSVIGEHIVERRKELCPDGGRVFALRRTGNNFDVIKKDLINDFYNIRMNGLYYRYDIEDINVK